MNTIHEAVLREMRDERDSWIQAKRKLQDMKVAAGTETKMLLCLDAAIRYALDGELRATEMLEATEDIINALTPKPKQ